ncbi:MAG: DUF4407 domain-containing protein [Muribaculaceae bacterium]
MKTNEIKKDTTSVKKNSWLNEFLWSCAGVNKHVLRQCPSDYSKYAGIGGTILFTALMAALSGGYALNFVFDNVNIAIGFGVFWGLLIFNLDRFIVNTMYSDGKYTISWAELRSGLPRIIMAIFLGIVISTPLELKIFYKEIDAQMQKDMKSKVDEYVKEDKVLLDSLRTQRERLREAPLDAHFVGSLGSTDLEVQQKVNELSNLRKTETELNNQITTLTYQIRKLDASHNHNDSIKAKQLRNRRTPIQGQLNNTRSQIRELDVTVRSLSSDYKGLMEKAERQREKDISSLDGRILSLENKTNSSETSYRGRLKKNFGGLRAQMKAFSELRKEDRTTDIAAWFIMLLFVIIETAPTFFKMMMEDGPYDKLLKAEKHRTKVLADKRISDVNDAVNTCVRISTMKNEKRLEAEIIANQDILEKIARAQSELLETAIEQWKETELEKIRQNPTAYIMSSFPEENKSQKEENGVISEFIHNNADDLLEEDDEEFKGNTK